jgi:hypothetical protein
MIVSQSRFEYERRWAPKKEASSSSKKGSAAK